MTMAKKGEVIVIKHRSDGNGHIEGVRSCIERIVDVVYTDGAVRDNRGEKWYVRRGSDGKLYSVS